MQSNSTITVLGAGYVGLTTAALLAHAGYTVYALEPNKERLDAIKDGRSFFYEQGIDPIISAALKAGTLIPTDSYKDSVPNSSIVFSCVGTPDNPDGSSNLTYIFAAAKEAMQYLEDGAIYIQKSTVPVGTGRRIEELFSETGKDITYLSNPEFLREGTALYDTLYFDRVVVGGDNKEAVTKILNLYRQLETRRDTIATLAGINPSPRKGQYIPTSLNSAELIKVTSNAFLALKISFANSIAKLADKVDADIIEVMDAVGADERIGRAFLNAGRGYGGGCFPKDVSGLIASGLEHGVDLDIMNAAKEVNESMPGYVISKIQATCGELGNKTIAVLGLSFKKGTSDTRKSPGVQIANILAKNGATVRAYDPQANDEASQGLVNVTLKDTFSDTIRDTDIIVVTTDWNDFLALTEWKFIKNSRQVTVVDSVNMFSRKDIEGPNVQYVGIGR